MKRRWPLRRAVVDADSDPAGAQLLALASAVAANAAYAEEQWTGITLVASIEWGYEVPLVGCYGYYYTATPVNADKGGQTLWQARVPRPSGDVDSAFVALATRMAERDEGAPWKHCLFQLHRSGAIRVRFSHELERPWNPNIPRLNDWVEGLRPSEHEEPQAISEGHN